MITYVDHHSNKKQISITGDSLIYTTPKLWIRRRNNRILLVEPETACWLILDPLLFSIICQVNNTPITVNQLLLQNNIISQNDFLTILTILFEHQIVSINGNICYNHLNMWQTKSFPSLIVLDLTEKCNYACTYCYREHSTQKSKGKLEILKYIIKRIFYEFPIPDITIEYHGGEPLLEFDLLIAVSEYANELSKLTNKTLVLLCQTNASLLTSDKIRALKKLNVSIGVSIDGTPRIHNKQRVDYAGRGTFDKTWHGIETFKQIEGGFAPICVICEPRDYYEAFNFFLEQGCTNFVFHRLAYLGRAQNQSTLPITLDDDFSEALLNVVDMIYKHNLKYGQGSVKLREIENFFTTLLTKTRTFMCYKSPCGAGSGQIAFDVHGNYYPCDEFVGREEFKIGNIYDDSFLPAKITNSTVCKMLLKRDMQLISRCKNCPWKYSCGESCASKIHRKFGTIMKESHFCRYQEIVIEELIWKIDKHPHIAEFIMGKEFMSQHNIAINQFSYNFS